MHLGKQVLKKDRSANDDTDTNEERPPVLQDRSASSTNDIHCLLLKIGQIFRTKLNNLNLAQISGTALGQLESRRE